MTGCRVTLGASVFIVVLAAACGHQSSSSQPELEPADQVGRIRGTVRLRGAAPAVRTEVNSKTPDVCGSKVSVTRLQVGPHNGVSHAFVYLEGIESRGPLRPAASVTIEQKDCLYGPRSVVVSPRAPLEIVNQDPVLHNVHASAISDGGLQSVFNIAQPVRGQRTKIESELTPGIVKLTCEAGHPWMTAHMLVTPHDYVAVTDEAGRFVIDNVPVGEYSIKMWHEGVTLTRIIASLERYEYEPPYEVSKEVVVTEGGTSEVEFEFGLRQ